MSALGKANKKPAYGINNNIKDVVMQADLLLKPKNELDQWKNLSLNCCASKELTILCTDGLEDVVTLKFVKLGPIVIVSMDSFNFTADATGPIRGAIGSIPAELAPNTNHAVTCRSHSIDFKTNGGFDIYSGYASHFTSGTAYPIYGFYCTYTTN